MNLAESRYLLLGIFIGALAVGIGLLIHQASGEEQKPLVCLYEPLDLFMDSSLIPLFESTIQQQNVTEKTLSIYHEIMDDNSNCKVIVKIERSINENYGYTDHTTPYQISKNVLTVFVYKNTIPFNPNAQPMHAMLNWNCELQAHESKYFNNYHISDEGYSNTYRGYCNPYYMQNPSKSGELPQNVIKDSMEKGLEALLQ